jgi:hypothetical protein
MNTTASFDWSNIVLLAYYVLVITYNVYIETISNSFDEKNRYLTGRLVWLSVLPIFGVIWMYIFNHAVNKSIEKEIQEHQLNYRFLGVTGTLFPTLLLGLFSLYSVLELIYVPAEHTDSGLWAELFLFFMYLSFAFWIIYIAEIVCYIKFISNTTTVNYISIAIWVLSLIAASIILYFTYSYFSELSALREYERGLN